MTDTDTVRGDLQPIASHADWMPLARDAYRRLVDRFAAVTDDEWTDPTPCDGWSVRDLGGHVLGSMRAAASLRETLSQQRAVARRVRRSGEQDVDAMTAIQIERTADRSVSDLVDEMDSLVDRAVRGRTRLPGPVRRRAGFHVKMGAVDERWTLDYFLGCILTRDAWLHRIDLADALGDDLALDDVDRRIVGDVAAEWARRHGRPVDLTLTGPAGGHLTVGHTGDPLAIDAIEFCRVVSGRSSHPHPLMSVEVPF